MTGCTSSGNLGANQKDSPRLYECPICKLHFESKELAAKCEDWCTKNESCNLAIAKHSIEARKNK